QRTHGPGSSPRSSAHAAVFGVGEPGVLRLPRLAAATFWGDAPGGYLDAGSEVVFQLRGVGLSADEVALACCSSQAASVVMRNQLVQSRHLRPPGKMGASGLTRRCT